MFSIASAGARKIWRLLIVFWFVALLGPTLSISAHSSLACGYFWVQSAYCTRVYDYFFETWRLRCFSTVELRYACVERSHLHDYESVSQRNSRVLGKMASCIRSAVASAESRCAHHYQPCMQRDYEKTLQYVDILKRNLISSGKLRDANLKNPNSNSGPVGSYDTNSQTIYVDVSKHIGKTSDIAYRENQLAQTIVHEKIHMQDHQNGNSAQPEGEVDQLARVILREIFNTSYNPGSSCSIYWEQQNKVIYGY